MEYNDPKIILMLTSGPPACGKTTFVKNFFNQLTQFINMHENHQINGVLVEKTSITSIHYDEFIDELVEKTLIESNNWKISRNIMLNLINCLVKYVKNRFKGVFMDYIKQIQEDLRNQVDHIQENFGRIIEKFNNLASNVDKKAFNYIILIDDNFYFESMRIKVYQMAKNERISYLSIYFPIKDLNSLLKRNENRVEQVEPHVIENILTKYESPKDISWEIDKSYEVKENQCSFKDLIILTMHLFKECNIKNNVESQVEKQLSIEANLKSLKHNADLIIRKLISSELSKCTFDKAKLASELNLRKSQLLNKLNILNENSQILINLNKYLTYKNQLEFENLIKELFFSI